MRWSDVPVTRLNKMLDALYTVYGDAAQLTDRAVAHLVVDHHNLLSVQEVPGVTIDVQASDEAIEVELSIAAGSHVALPVHLCIGMLEPLGKQLIRKRIRIEDGASARFIAHCLFPIAQSSRHAMNSEVELGEGAQMSYSEGHYHGPGGGIEVVPRATIGLAPGAHYASDFSLTTGRVGKLHIDYSVTAYDRAVAEVSTRVFGHASDEIRIKDELFLSGKEARGLLKSRVAVEGRATSEVIGITHGDAAGARGHMDCVEIVRDQAIARAEPIVYVSHPEAKVTHEAAVGTVDQKQLETLMARGLTPDEAIDVVITGMLR